MYLDPKLQAEMTFQINNFARISLWAMAEKGNFPPKEDVRGREQAAADEVVRLEELVLDAFRQKPLTTHQAVLVMAKTLAEDALMRIDPILNPEDGDGEEEETETTPARTHPADQGSRQEVVPQGPGADVRYPVGSDGRVPRRH